MKRDRKRKCVCRALTVGSKDQGPPPVRAVLLSPSPCSLRGSVAY